MRRMAMAVGLLAGMCLIPAAEGQQNRTWWVMGEFGEGQFRLSSDQVQSKVNPTFALGFAGGHRLGNRARAGLHVNGWLLQAFNLNDPMVGQSVTNVMGVVDAFPFRNWRRFFVRGGFGLAMYTDNRKTESGGKGPAWEGDAGCDIPLSESLFLTPVVAYSGGRFNDVRNYIGASTGRGFSVVDFKIAVTYHFGHRKE